MREPWLNLNGRWRFALGPNDVGGKEGWFKAGACDREAKVWLNGVLVKEHVGGQSIDLGLTHTREKARPHSEDNR